MVANWWKHDDLIKDGIDQRVFEQLGDRLHKTDHQALERHQHTDAHTPVNHFESARANLDAVRQRHRNEQEFLTAHLSAQGKVAYWPEMWCRSFKRHCVKPFPFSFWQTPAIPEGAKIVVFHLPELRELKPYPFPDVTEKVKKAVDAAGMPFVDMLPSVENMEPASLWVTVPDPHPNGKADIAFAAFMVKTLAPMLDELCKTQNKGCKQ